MAMMKEVSNPAREVRDAFKSFDLDHDDKVLSHLHFCVTGFLFLLIFIPRIPLSNVINIVSSSSFRML